MSRIRVLLLSTLISLGAAATAQARIPVLKDRDPSQRPALLVLGLAHFANPGADAENVEFDDVLAPQRQREVEAIVEALAAWRPTRVVVEFPADRQARLDQRYADYRAGKYELTRDEIDQIGLRLAAKLDLARVDAADWNEMPPGTEADFDFEIWANANGESARFKRLFNGERGAAQQALLARSTLPEFLCVLNHPAELADSAQVYYDIALFGDAQVNPGAVWVGNWHARNLKILANLVRIADQPGDRVLAIYGAGHKPLLDRFAEESLAFRVDDARQALGCR